MPYLRALCLYLAADPTLASWLLTAPETVADDLTKLPYGRQPGLSRLKTPVVSS